MDDNQNQTTQQGDQQQSDPTAALRSILEGDLESIINKKDQIVINGNRFTNTFLKAFAKKLQESSIKPEHILAIILNLDEAVEKREIDQKFMEKLKDENYFNNLLERFSTLNN